jgi:uncharacterized phage-associated protein
MEKQIDSVNLAYYIINSKKYPNLSHLKLQKLLYYIQSWHLVFFDKKLFDDDFQAWVHGPVSRKIYDAFKDESILHNELNTDFSKNANIESMLTDEQIELINDVLDEYGDKTPYHLECLTHEEKPWKEARGSCSLSQRCTNTISEDIIKEYYTTLIA